MNSNLKLLFLSLGFVIVGTTLLNAQNCYIRLDDASGWSTDSYQSSLEQAAYDLVQIFPPEIQDSFRVFDFGFYIHNMVMQDSYQGVFDLVTTTIQSLNPYYLALGRINDVNGLNTGLLIDFNLPKSNTQAFECLSSSSNAIIKDLLLIEVNDDIQIYQQQLNIIKKLKLLLDDVINSNCDFSLSNNDIKGFFAKNGFDSLAVELDYNESYRARYQNNARTIEVNQLDLSPNKTIFDYNIVPFIYNEIYFDPIEELTSKILDLSDSVIVKSILSENEIFRLVNGIYVLTEIQETFNNKEHHLNIWMHLLEDNNEDMLYYKVVSNLSYIDSEPKIDETKIDDMDDFGPNILADGLAYSCFSFRKFAADNIAKSLNAIYKRQYGITYDAFSVESFNSIPVMMKNPKYGWFSSFFTGEEKFLEERGEIHKVVTNSLFNWNEDKYTKALFDILNTNRNILFDFKSKLLPYYRGSTLEDVKGWTGKDCCRGFTYISDHMIPINSTTGWNKGGTFMHETITHMHHTGILEPAHPMQIFYDFETSATNHDGSPYMNWSETEKNRLENLRAQTGQ